MRIAIAQTSTRAGDFDATAARMVELSVRAAEQDVDLLVFPAPALCGTSPVAYPDREGYLLDLAECLVRLADDLACPCLVPVLTDLDGVPLPEAMLIADGDITPVRLSTYIASMAQGDGEADARALPELEFAGARLGVAFTYDDLDDYDDYQYDVDVILFLSGYGFATDDPSSALGSSLAEGRYLADAEATGAWIVGVGPLGCYESQVFCGSSFVLAPWGELAAQAPSLEEALLVCDVDPSAEGPLAEPLTPEVYDAPLATWGALVSGLSGAIERSGSDGACVLLDGSLSSLLVATLATDALGPTRVHALVAAGEASRSAAEQSVRALRLPDGAVTRLDSPGEGDAQLARDLAQVRLSELARQTGSLALGSDDKTTLALEPPLGVTAARLQPVGDLYRSDVVALAHLRNTISPVIPASAFAGLAAPDVEGLAEAFPSVEGRVEFVDLVLSSRVEWELPLTDIVSERGHAELVTAIIERLRETAPACAGRGAVLAVSSKTLEEAREPWGLAWADHVRSRDERAGEGIMRALARGIGGMGTEGQGDEKDEEPREPTEAEQRRDMSDLLGYLRDFLPGGGFSGMGPMGPAAADESRGRHDGEDGPSHPLWDGPFSEN